MTTEHFGVLTQAQAGKVEERQRVAVSGVEEEMGPADLVTGLEQVGQRELEQTLVERDRPNDVRRDQGLMMHAAS